MSDKMSKYVSQLCHIMSDKLTNRMPDKLSDCLSKYTPDTGGDHSKKKKFVSALILPLSLSISCVGSVSIIPHLPGKGL